MIEELREQANANYEEDATLPAPTPPAPARFLGMTPFQTFFVALLLLLITCLLSAACLLVTGRIALPL